MPRALLIADLEGVAGVEALGALIAGDAAHAAACEAMTAEVCAAVEGLRAAGYDAVRVSDSHRSGSGRLNVDPFRVAAELRFEDDLYGGALLDDVAVVAAVGMHAAGGTRGFGAHTVDLHTAWQWGEALLSESEVAFGLAAERGVPALYSAGDDVLRRSLRGLRYVETKRSRGPSTCRSATAAAVHAALREAALATPALRPLPARRRLALHFKREAHADAAAGAGARRDSPFTVSLPAARFTDSYHRALEVIAATAPLVREELTGAADLVAAATGLLTAAFPSLQRPRQRAR